MAGACLTGSDDDLLFAEAVADADPLPDRDRVPPPRAPAIPADCVGEPASPELRVEADGDQICGRAPGVSRRQLIKLRRVAFRPPEVLDLHGMTAAEARTALAGFLAAAVERGARQLLLITGKGRHSAAGPVLRDLAVAELAGPLRGPVAGFLTAGHRQGGTGALCILLRRPPTPAAPGSDDPRRDRS